MAEEVEDFSALLALVYLAETGQIPGAGDGLRLEGYITKLEMFDEKASAGNWLGYKKTRLLSRVFHMREIDDQPMT